MHNIEIILKDIPTQDYIEKFRDIDKFIEFCKVCNNYNSLWSCPPLADNFYSCINNYRLTTIIGLKINVDPEVRHSASSTEQRNALIKEILGGVRREYDHKLLALESNIEGSLLYYAGSCLICTPKECTRKKGKECRHPHKMRTTLEAIGFDMGRTTSELLGVEMKWCEGNTLPEYFTLVYGFLCNDSVINNIKL